MKLSKIIVGSFCIAVFIAFIMAVNVLAAPTQKVTYMYYGKEWTIEDIQERWKNETPFHCIQHITSASYRGEDADLFFCFDTYTEVEQDIINQANTLTRMDKYLANLLSWTDANSAETILTEKKPTSSVDHWSLYYHSGYNTLVGTILNDSGIPSVGGGGVWSLWRTGTPRNLTIYWKTNYQGNTWTYANTQWTLLPFPFGGGGGQSAKVP